MSRWSPRLQPIDGGVFEALASPVSSDFGVQAREVLRLVGSEGALVHAVLARVAWQRSDAAAARQALVAAQRVRPLLTYAQPHVAVQARLELARVRLARGDLAAARTKMREIDDVLTAAELRVLPFLATHLSFPEIGAELFLSPNTVKSQAISAYQTRGRQPQPGRGQVQGTGPPGGMSQLA